MMHPQPDRRHDTSGLGDAVELALLDMLSPHAKELLDKLILAGWECEEAMQLFEGYGGSPTCVGAVRAYFNDRLQDLCWRVER